MESKLSTITTLDYSADEKYDIGRFVARYFRVLGILSILATAIGMLIAGGVNIDLSPIAYFVLAHHLQKRAPAARIIALVLCIGVFVVIVIGLVAKASGLGGDMTLSLGTRKIVDPKWWQVLLFAAPLLAIFSVPLLALLSPAAKRQFSGPRNKPTFEKWEQTAATLSALAEMTTTAPSGPIRIAALGIERFVVDSEFLGRPTKIDVLLPDDFDPQHQYRVLYVLPAGGEFKEQPQFANGLQEIRKLGLHTKHDLICVMPEFDTVPWYGRHATDEKRRHDRHLIEIVLPLIEKSYPTTGKPMLIGFSKSGWGAISLLLRHPDIFESAAAWDAPLMMDQTNLRWASEEHFGTPEQAAKYAPVNLLDGAAKTLGGSSRIVLTGHDLYAEDTRAFHALLDEKKIPHAFDDVLVVKHRWDSGWLERTLTLLVDLERQ